MTWWFSVLDSRGREVWDRCDSLAELEKLKDRTPGGTTIVGGSSSDGIPMSREELAHPGVIKSRNEWLQMKNAEAEASQPQHT